MVKVVLVLEKMPMEGYSDIAVAVCVCSCIIRFGCNCFSSLSIFFLWASRFRNFVLHPCFVLGFHHRWIEKCLTVKSDYKKVHEFLKIYHRNIFVYFLLFVR